jgi:DNA-binding MarR family transcriptional regulator
MDTSNSKVMPNQRADERPAVLRALATFEIFQQRLVAVHAVDFTTLEITMSQAKLLYVLSAEGELTMSGIARRLGVTVSTASGAVEQLVGLGYLSRLDDPTNRRQVHVSLTPLGSQTLEQVRELSTRQLRKLFELLTDDDLEVVERATRIMSDAFSQTAHGAGTATSEAAIPSPPRDDAPRSKR